MTTIYVETSIIGYMTARSSDAVIFQARQQLTRQWWNTSRLNHRLVTSQLVIDEASAGDVTAAQERLQLLDGIPILDVIHPDVQPLADQLIANHLLPEKQLPRRSACGRSMRIWCRLFIDLELQTYCQRRDVTEDLSYATRSRL